MNSLRNKVVYNFELLDIESENMFQRLTAFVIMSCESHVHLLHIKEHSRNPIPLESHLALPTEYIDSNPI